MLLYLRGLERLVAEVESVLNSVSHGYQETIVYSYFTQAATLNILVVFL